MECEQRRDQAATTGSPIDRWIGMSLAFLGGAGCLLEAVSWARAWRQGLTTVDASGVQTFWAGVVPTNSPLAMMIWMLIISIGFIAVGILWARGRSQVAWIIFLVLIVEGVPGTLINLPDQPVLRSTALGMALITCVWLVLRRRHLVDDRKEAG